MTSILILKTGALGDVLRTTSILPGLHERYSDCRVSWVTAPAARDLVRLHPLVSEVLTFDSGCVEGELDDWISRLSMRTWDRLLSFDDEEPLCRLASAVPAKRLSGARMGADGRREYTPDVAPWFDMGLLSVHGKEAADRMKIDNGRSHPQIFAEMLGISMGKPILPADPAAERTAESFARRVGLHENGPVIGLNTGAGGRWHSKQLPVDRTAQLVVSLAQSLEGRVTFLLLGGPDERERNSVILNEIGPMARVIDGGCDNSMLDFAALVSRCDLLITSDSLALHIAVASNVRVVSFFAPTSAAEIELYGLGEKIVSTANDYCTYRPDVDTSTLTVDRLQTAVLRNLPGRN